MTRLFVRIPKNLSPQGSLYRLFNGTENKLEIKSTSSSFNLGARESITRFLQNDDNNHIDWTIIESNNSDTDNKLKFYPLKFKSEIIGVIWLPKNQYRPGDTIHGYIFLRYRPEHGKPLLNLCKKDENNPYILEIIDSSNTIIKVIPIEDPEQEIVFFESLIEKYHPIGKYTLQLKHNTTVLHSLAVTIATYDKPDIQINMKFAKWRMVGTPIDCTIQAKYYHGEPVKKASLIITAPCWDQPFTGIIDNGLFVGELPDLDIGDWRLEITVKDDVGRETKAVHIIKIVEEPFKLIYSTNPIEKPVVEKQPLEFILKTNDPLGKPLTGIKFNCSLKDDTKTEYIPVKEYITPKTGILKISLSGLKAGNYVFTAQSTNTEVSLQVTDSFSVRKSTTQDLWIMFKDVPATVEPGRPITGKIIISGAGLQLNNTNKLYLDVITDSIIDSQELEYKKDNNTLIVEIPFTVEIPSNYFGAIRLEAYFDPIIGGLFEKQPLIINNELIGESFIYPKTTANSQIEVQFEIPEINPVIDLPQEISTGNNFDVTIKFNEKDEKDYWLALALTDARLLMEYQPTNLNKTFYKIIPTVDILTIQSKNIPPPSQVRFFGLAPAGRFKMVGRKGDILASAVPKISMHTMMDTEFGVNAPYPTSTIIDEEISPEPISASDYDQQEDKIPHEIIRTEFPEDIVLRPVKINSLETKLSIKAPDSITAYKIFVLICTESYFTVIEKEILVRNPVFTSTQNPPIMILGDQIDIPTVIENLSSKTLQNLKIKAIMNECLKLNDTPFIEIGALKDHESVNVFWPVEAIKVGDAKFTTLLEGDQFTELAELQKPLRILPPGIHHPEFFRTILEAGKSWTQQVEITGDEAFVLGIVNFMPGIDLAIMEGVEALATYPYGCCEQTSATTLPNAVAYRYLEAKNKLTPETKSKLITNMKAGLERYKDEFRNPSNGGFGLWNGNEPSVFHTALAISVIGNIKSYIDVPEEIFKGARAYLASQQSTDGSYEPAHGVHQIFPATLTKLAMTAYVLHSQALGGVADEKALVWILSAGQQQILYEDPTVLALVLDTLGMLKPILKKNYNSQIHELSQKLVKIVNTCDKGSYWTKGSSLSSEIETTAYALIALVHNEEISSEILSLYQTGTNYLLNTRSSAGWFTTRDTLWACMSLGEIASKLPQSGLNGTFTVRLNNQIIKTLQVSLENRYYQIYNLRNIFLDRFVKGTNTISLDIQGSGAGHAVIELRKWYASKPRILAPITIEQQIKAAPNMNDQINIHYTIKTEKMFEAVMIEQPIPAGFVLDDVNLLGLRKLHGVDHVEINNNKISMFFTLLSSISFDIDFKATLKGKIQIDGLRIIPMYQPDQAVTSAVKRLEFVN